MAASPRISDVDAEATAPARQAQGPGCPPPPLELGIDIGDVDLVCQLGSPARSRAFCAARWPLRPCHRRHAEGPGCFRSPRDELVECAALDVDSVRRGELDCLAIPEQPLDVLAQQIVAEIART